MTNKTLNEVVAGAIIGELIGYVLVETVVKPLKSKINKK